MLQWFVAGSGSFITLRSVEGGGLSKSTGQTTHVHRQTHTDRNKLDSHLTAYHRLRLRTRLNNNLV